MDKGIEGIIADIRLKHGHNDKYAPILTWDELSALIAALEQAQRANAAQDDHINQQADRILQLEKKNAELGGQLSRYSMSPGQADQRMCESRAVRDALGFEKDAVNVAPADLRNRIDEMKARLAELEARHIQPIGMQFITEAIGAHGYIVGCLQQNRPDLALEESLKWMRAFGEAAQIAVGGTVEGSE